MKKNEIYYITIEDMGNDGEGIGHVAEASQGQEGSGRPKVSGNRQEGESGEARIAVFVKDTVVGDIARVRIVKVKKRYAYGRLEAIISPSPFRVEAPCVKARSCGGCTLMHMSYDKQLEYKWSKVRNCLERIGGLEDAGSLMEPIYGMEEPYHYRNKMQFPVGLDRNGTVQIGFYAGRTHSIIDLEDCKISHPVNDYIVRELRVWLQNWQDRTGSFIYDEEQHKGLVRHILTRVGFATGELMVCIIINGKELPLSVPGMNESSSNTIAGEGTSCDDELLEHVLRAVDNYNQSRYDVEGDIWKENSGQTGNCAGDHEMSKKELGMNGIRQGKGQAGVVTLKSLCMNRNQEKTNRILGDICKTLWGDPFITDFIGDVCFQISPLSFYQVNPIQTKVLYDKALEYADLSGKEIVWDMYCGIGTISLCLAQKARKVYGVEIVPQAIADARNNAALNELNNTEFFCGKAEEVVPEFYRKGENAGRHPDVVVVDPPRKGCEEILLQTIVEMAPKRLVYVSCDPATLARDVKRLGEMGYVVKKAAVVDQFGHSGHVETVVLMSQVKS